MWELSLMSRLPPRPMVNPTVTGKFSLASSLFTAQAGYRAGGMLRHGLAGGDPAVQCNQLPWRASKSPAVGQWYRPVRSFVLILTRNNGSELKTSASHWWGIISLQGDTWG